jgi:hypothetical protein
MCQWAATNLTASGCTYFDSGQAHQYQSRDIYLCSDARKIASSPEVWEPCSNYVGKDGREAADIGTPRKLNCPVCTTQAKAEAECARLKQEAITAYHAAVAAADAARDAAVANSTMVVHYVS